MKATTRDYIARGLRKLSTETHQGTNHINELIKLLNLHGYQLGNKTLDQYNPDMTFKCNIWEIEDSSGNVQDHKISLTEDFYPEGTYQYKNDYLRVHSYIS